VFRGKTVLFLAFLRAIAEGFARLSYGLGVCSSVTLLYCVKTVQARITNSLCDKILCPWVWGFPSNASVKEGYPPKKTLFCRIWQRLQIATADMLLIITSTGDKLFRFTNIDDL